MSTLCWLFIISSSFFFSCISIVNGAIYRDENGTIVTGDNLLSVCRESKLCDSDFRKNVYASSQPYLERQYTQLLFPEMYDQFDSDKECGTGSKFVTMGSCAQIHSPYTPEHEEGELKVKYVEEQYTLKWEYIRNSETPVYDAILDNSAVFWVNDLSYYYTIWTELGADIVYLTWTIKDTNNNVQDSIKSQTYYSMITHNGDAAMGSTLTQYELISDKFSGLTDEIEARMITSEQRVFFDANTNYREYCNSCQTYPIGARRAVTNIEENIKWYLDVFESTIVDKNVQIIQDTFVDYNNNIVRYAHVKLNNLPRGVTVSFFERDNELGTYGDFKILDFEKGMTNSHNELMLNPYCGISRWFDNHMALGFADDYLSALVFKKIMESGYKYTVYDECGKIGGDCLSDYIPLSVFMAEPNGHSLQMVLNPTNFIQFKISPNQWDADWCPISCNDERSSYSYGDAIATFTFESDSTNDMSTDSDDDDDGLLFVGLDSTTNMDNNNTNNILFIGIGAVIIGALILLSMYGYKTNKMNKDIYEQLA